MTARTYTLLPTKQTIALAHDFFTKTLPRIPSYPPAKFCLSHGGFGALASNLLPPLLAASLVLVSPARISHARQQKWTHPLAWVPKSWRRT